MKKSFDCNARNACRYLTLASLLCFAPLGRAATVTFTDNFNASGVTWTTSNPSGSGVVTAPTTGGNTPGSPSGYQLTTFTNGGETYNLMSSATYIPSTQGAILTLSMGFDFISSATSNSSQFFPLLIQNGHGYRSITAATGTTSWQTYSTGTLGAANFFCLDAGCGSSPNFTDPMQFGYITLRQSGTAALGVDNFNVTITTAAPEPAAWGLMGGGLMLAAALGRRRGLQS